MSDPRSEPTPHYFSPAPDGPSDPRTVRVTLPDLSVDLVSDRGVFSHRRLDPGTRLLLLEAPLPLPDETTIVDLGCGWGPIACVTARRAPHATVWAVDVNERARRLTAANAERLGLTNVRVAAPDDVPADLTVDRLLSNPPIRIGRDRLRRLLAIWLDRLSPTGRAHLVVQRHLGADSLARHLVGTGHPV
ncbi:MAG: methyltransferase domain-containing protein, partial [Actinomyces sp.]